MRRLFLALLALPVFAACDDPGNSTPTDTIQDTFFRPDVADVTDTSVPDTADTADTTSPDTLVPDTADTSVDTADAVLPDTADTFEDATDTTSPDATEVVDTTIVDTNDVLDTSDVADVSEVSDTTPSSTSAQIQAIITAGAGATAPVAIDLAIDDATVTMVKPLFGTEKPGFFLQADQVGPAIFVVHEGSTVVAADDLVSLRAKEVSFVGGVVEVTVFETLVVEAGAGDATALVQDVNDLDLASSYDALQSEAVAFEFEIVQVFASAGTGYQSARIITEGTPIETDNLKVRIPATVVSALVLGPGCLVSVDYAVIWRFKGSGDFSQVQPSVFDASAMDVVCNGPELRTAAAASATEVVLTFDKAVDQTSITNPATQFTIAGLTVSAAAVGAANTVKLTTSTQVPSQAYVVNVAASVTDAADRAVIAEGAARNFAGFAGVTKLIINEVDYDQPGADGQEFLEIYNPNAIPVDLAGYRVILVNGGTPATPVFYPTSEGFSLAGLIPALGYAVVCGSGVAVAPDAVTVTVVVPADGFIQNGGNDGVQLRTVSGIVVDALLYEAQATVAATLLAFGEGTPFAGGDSGVGLQSVARCPNGADSDANVADFAVSTNPTPGAANVCPTP